MKDTTNPQSLTSNSKTPEKCLQMSYSKRYFTASFRADPELWSHFKGECTFRGVSVCHVLEALMEAWIEGQKATATVIKPVVVNLTMQHIVERPRRLGKIDEIMADARAQAWPPNCEFAVDFWKGSKMVGCKKQREMTELVQCWRCFWREGYR